MAAPWPADRVAGEEALWGLAELAQDREGDDLAARAPGDAERARHRVPPLADERALVGRLVAADDLEDRVAVVGTGGLDRVVLDDRGEERLADERLVDEVDHVRERRPAGRAGGALELVADLPPGRASVRAPAHGVGRAEQRGDALADRVVDDQALAAELDERQRAQPLEGIRRGGQHSAEQGQASRDGARRWRRAPRVSRRRARPATAPASSCTTVGSTASSGASGRSRTADAASCRDSGWPRTKRLTHSACVSSSPAPSSTSAASAGDSGPSGIVHRSSPNEERQTAPGASRVPITTRAFAGSDGKKHLAEPAVEQAQVLGGVDAR